MDLIAVCCVDEIPIKVVNRFLPETYGFSASMTGGRRGENENLVIVDTLSKSYSQPTKALDDNDDGTGVLSSPFIGKSLEVIEGLVRELAKSSKITTKHFIVLDKRSATDSTVLAVKTSNVDHNDDANPHPWFRLHSVRIDFCGAYMAVCAAQVAHPPLWDVMESAETKPGKVARYG